MKMPKMPSSEEMVAEAAQALRIPDLSPTEVRRFFDNLLKSLSEMTLSIYERYEEQLNAQALPRQVLEANPAQLTAAEEVNQAVGFKEAALALLKSLYPDLRRAFLSVSQGRKSRGGKSFEEQFALLLTFAGFPFQQQHDGYRTDFVLPSSSAFERNRTRCVVASLKRTLRERWQEVAGELRQLQAPNVFLVTGDPKVSAGQVQGICDNNLIYLVVWDSVKDKYKSHPRVLGFSEFANEWLPMLQQQWAKAGLGERLL